VLEVGCGTGLLSCVAARLGATKVYAVETTELATRARRLVEANGLSSVVDVIRANIEDLAPEPVEVAFSELMNADPYFEGVLPAMEAAAKWVVPGGVLSPRRVQVHVALAWVEEPAEEYAKAMREVKRICAQHLIDAGPLLATLDVPHPHRYTTSAERAVSTVALAFDHPVGTGPVIDHTVVEVTSAVDGRIGGAIVWFAAEVDEDLWMSNPPGMGSHWGQMVCGWREPLSVTVGQVVRLEVRRLRNELVVRPAT
jgi:SAM-dependent methyltransferase